MPTVNKEVTRTLKIISAIAHRLILYALSDPSGPIYSNIFMPSQLPLVQYIHTSIDTYCYKEPTLATHYIIAL